MASEVLAEEFEVRFSINENRMAFMVSLSQVLDSIYGDDLTSRLQTCSYTPTRA